MSHSLRADLAKLDRYTRQFRFLRENRIGSATELTWYTDALKNEIAILTERRKPLYTQRRLAWEAERPAITAEIDSINAALRPLRRQLYLCEQIAQDAERIGQKVEAVQVTLERAPKMVKSQQKANYLVT